jgi:hypothetical protein
MAAGRIAAALALLVLAGRAGAGELAAVYAVEWGGVTVGEIAAELREEAGTYRMAWRGRAVGLLGRLFPFASEGSSEGRREAGRFVSARYRARSERRDGGGAWQVAFGPDGRATRVELPAEAAESREPVPEALRVGPDPAALLLTALAAAGPGVRLEGHSYDGKRAVRYALACAGGGAERAAAGALACTVEGRLLAGASRRWRAEREAAEARREPVRVRLEPGPWPGGWLPVGIELPTRFGAVTARLVRTEPRPHMGG